MLDARDGWNEIKAVVSYRADRFLERQPLLQVAVLFALAVAVIAGWAVALTHLDTRAPSGSDAIWWALTRFLDGGTMAGDPDSLRALATMATVSGVIGVAVLTSVLTSKMAERVGVLGLGLSPVVERGHYLILGFDSRVPVIVSELAQAEKRAVVVILSASPRAEIEAAVEAQLEVAREATGLRLEPRVVVRTGDRQREGALRKVRAGTAKAILLLPPKPTRADDGGPSDPVSLAFVSLLAIRRAAAVVKAGAPEIRVVVVTEACGKEAAEAERRLMVAVAGQTRVKLRVLHPVDTVGSVLALCVAHPGLGDVLRSLVQFDEVDFAMASGSPNAREIALTRSSAERPGVVVLRRSSAAPVDADVRSVDAAKPPRTVQILGANASLSALLEKLPEVLGEGLAVRVTPQASPAARSVADQAAARAVGLEVKVDKRDPLTVAREDPVPADVVVILASDSSRVRTCDAFAVELLLNRHANKRVAGCRTITEVHHGPTRDHLSREEQGGDFLISTELVAMLLAQNLADFVIGEVLDSLLSLRGASLSIRPSPREGTFAELASSLGGGAGSATDDVLLGYLTGNAVRLVPDPAVGLPAGALLIVLERRGPATR